LLYFSATYGCLYESKSPTRIEISGPAYAKIKSFSDTLSAGWRNCDDLDLEVVKPAHTCTPWAHADGWPPSPTPPAIRSQEAHKLRQQPVEAPGA